MAYRLTYSFSMDWIGPGMGQSAAPAIYGNPSSGNAQTLELFNKAGGQTIQGTGTGGIIQTADITSLTNAMAADAAAQLGGATVLAQLQGWTTGNP